MKPMAIKNTIVRRASFGLMTTLLVLVVSAASTQAQDKKFDVKTHLANLDKNKNGRLEPDEVSGRTESWLKETGFNTSESISIKKIIGRVEKDKRDREDKSRRDDDGRQSAALKVAGFGVSDGGNPVSGFGLSDVTPLTTNYSEEVHRQFDETLDRYDANKDGMLDSKELSKGRWGTPRPEVSDTNGDGKLSRIELLNRYYLREQYRMKAESKAVSDDKKSYDREKRSTDRGRFGSSSSSTSNSSRSTSRSTPSTSSSSGSKSTSSAASSDRIAKYAESLIKNYDKDADGKLSKDEMKKMRSPPTGADADKDGFVTKEEYVDVLSGKKSDSDSKKSDSNKDAKRESKSRDSSSSSSSSSRSSGSFGDLDSNGDNQVEMHEYSKDWDQDKISEFYAKDKNGDGVITAREWSAK